MDWLAPGAGDVMRLALATFGCFGALLGWVLMGNLDMFAKRHARRHRLVGLALLAHLLLGFVHLFFGAYALAMPWLPYDVLLGVLGTTVTLTAAADFRFHDKVRNKASGTLEKDTTVSYSEMVEHSFYQGLNVVQICVLHAMALDWLAPWQRYALAMAATAPWLLRGQFPVNSFSRNYKDLALKDYTTEVLLYRVKHYQYIFYKHALLHGLNVSVACGSGSIVTEPLFRLYWLGLNASYVFEFFLQTLVKRRYMSQGTLLLLQKLLMLGSSFGALFVLSHVRIGVSLASVALNFCNRGHDFANTLALLLGTVAYDSATTALF